MELGRLEGQQVDSRRDLVDLANRSLRHEPAEQTLLERPGLVGKGHSARHDSEGQQEGQDLRERCHTARRQQTLEHKAPDQELDGEPDPAEQLQGAGDEELPSPGLPDEPERCDEQPGKAAERPWCPLSPELNVVEAARWVVGHGRMLARPVAEGWSLSRKR